MKTVYCAGVSMPIKRFQSFTRHTSTSNATYGFVRCQWNTFEVLFVLHTRFAPQTTPNDSCECGCLWCVKIKHSPLSILIVIFLLHLVRFFFTLLHVCGACYMWMYVDWLVSFSFVLHLISIALGKGAFAVLNFNAVAIWCDCIEIK